MKFLLQQLKRLRQWVVIQEFNKYFGRLVYSFEKTDEKIQKLNQVQRTDYYNAVSAWLSSEAYLIEYSGELNELYHELAATSQNEDVITAYRLVIMKLKNRDIRLKQKAAEALAMKAFKTTTTNLK